jgi:hypothetical protein
MAAISDTLQIVTRDEMPEEARRGILEQAVKARERGNMRGFRSLWNTIERHTPPEQMPEVIFFIFGPNTIQHEDVAAQRKQRIENGAMQIQSAQNWANTSRSVDQSKMIVDEIDKREEDGTL